MNENNFSFNSENLLVDWISFNLEGLMDPRIIARRLLKYFTPHVLIDDVPSIGFHGLKKKYKVSIRQYTGSKGYWVGTQIIFSGKNAAYFYKLIQTQRFNWDLLKFEEHTLTLGRIDLCFSRPNDANHKSRSFDAFLVDSRSQVQNHTNTKYMKLQDFPDGKMLKINRRNNSRHYRVYQKDEITRFELELKHGQTRLVQNYLFQNQLDIFEHQLALQYFEYSGQVLRSDYPYADWVLDFQRRYRATMTFRPVVCNYLENQIIKTQEEEKKFFHLLQFLSFVKSLRLNPLKDCKKLKIKKQFYYELKFPLSQFVNFTGMQLSNQYERKNLISYFYQLQKLDPIVKVFSNLAFRSYVCFPYVDCKNTSSKSWIIEVLIVEELFSFPYPFQLPEYFLRSASKNDLRLKVRLLKSLAISDREKRLDLEEFFNPINVQNADLIKIKKNIIWLLSKLVENKVIWSKVEIILKSGKKRDRLIQNLTVSDITRRIKYIKFYEIV